MSSDSTRVPTPPRDGWSVETALDHLLALIASNDRRYEERFAAQERALEVGFIAAREAVNAALTSADRAVQKAETAAERRFDSVNEFRSTLADQQRTLIPRAEVDVLMRAFTEKIDRLQTQVDSVRAEAREKDSRQSGSSLGWAAAIALVTFILLFIPLGAIAFKFLLKF